MFRWSVRDSAALRLGGSASAIPASAVRIGQFRLWQFGVRQFGSQQFRRVRAAGSQETRIADREQCSDSNADGSRERIPGRDRIWLRIPRPRAGAVDTNFGSHNFVGGPIVGVASLCKDNTIREFNHKKKYKEWCLSTIRRRITADSSRRPTSPHCRDSASTGIERAE